MKIKGYEIKPFADLTGADLSYADLTGTDLSYANLSRANLTGANLTGANLKNSKLIFSVFIDANLTNCNLIFAKLTGANLTHANLTSANLTKADLISANLLNANLTDTKLFYANLTGANLATADLTGTKLFGAKLIRLRPKLLPKHLVKADFTKDHLSEEDITIDSTPDRYFELFQTQKYNLNLLYEFPKYDELRIGVKYFAEKFDSSLYSKVESYKIKIKINCCYFPKWYEGNSIRRKDQTIELELWEFKSLVITEKTELPYLNKYLILKDNNIEKLFEDISNLILKRFENVCTVYTEIDLQKIYTNDFKWVLKNGVNIFEIPVQNNNSKIHKRKEYSSYFNNDILSGAINEKTPFISAYIGFTGRSKEELLKGIELKCELVLDNSDSKINDYIFIEGITVLKKTWPTGPISEYYIIPENLIEQATKEFSRIVIKNKNVKSIIVKCNLFDYQITSFDKISKDNHEFEKNIEYYYNLVFDHKDTPILIKKFKGKYKTFIESNTTGYRYQSYSGEEDLYGWDPMYDHDDYDE